MAVYIYAFLILLYKSNNLLIINLIQAKDKLIKKNKKQE